MRRTVICTTRRSQGEEDHSPDEILGGTAGPSGSVFLAFGLEFTHYLELQTKHGRNVSIRLGAKLTGRVQRGRIPEGVGAGHARVVEPLAG